MILSLDDKNRFREAMEYFKAMLENDLKLINKSLELKLISFGIPIENHNDFLYFDFPYHYNVDEINDLLLPNQRFDDVDTTMYNLLNSSLQEPKFVAYNFEVDRNHVYVADICHLSTDTNNGCANTGILEDFFKIMYYSAFPEQWPGISKMDLNVKIQKGAFKKWFIVIHNEDIKDSSNTILSNYGIVLNESFDENFKKNLSSITSKLTNFSKFYGSRDFNVILRKNVEYSDMVLSLNYELFHHIKELHSNFTMEPLRDFRKKNRLSDEIEMIFENTGRIHQFYEDYMEVIKANFIKKDAINIKSYFDENHFTDFIDVIKNRYEDFIVKIYGHVTATIEVPEPCFKIILREIILNAVKAFALQLKNKKNVHIYCRLLEKNIFLQFTIISEGTQYICADHNSVGVVPLQSNVERRQTGVGLFLINNLLRKISAHCYDVNKQLFFNILEKYEAMDGYAIQFALPLHIETLTL